MIPAWVVVVLVSIIIIQEFYHRSERKDLYNRLMCHDINDFKAIEKPKTRNNPLSGHRRVINKLKGIKYTE